MINELSVFVKNTEKINRLNFLTTNEFENMCAHNLDQLIRANKIILVHEYQIEHIFFGVIIRRV